MLAGAAGAVFLGDPIVQLVATVSKALPAVASHAIGYADPRDGTHSHGFGAYEDDGEDQDDPRVLELDPGVSVDASALFPRHLA
jgi:hypothetical protein